MRELLDYFAAPGPLTPADARFATLPRDVEALCHVIQGLLLHPVEAHHYGVRLSRTRWRELSLCQVPAMLQRIEALDAAPLYISRPPQRRLIGNCRDFATLLCAFLRAQHTPARVRYGFARYFAPAFYTDHVICEYWQAQEQRWVRVDALVDGVLRQVYAIRANPLDLASTEFLAAGTIWQQYRAGLVDAREVGLSPSGPTGEDFMRAGVFHDVAAMSKVELLCQDHWELSNAMNNEERRQIFDALADWTSAADAHLGQLQAAFTQHALLNAPPAIRKLLQLPS